MRTALASLLLLVALPARAQFQPEPLRLPATVASELAAARLVASGGGDLLVLEPPGGVFTAFLRHGALLAPAPPPVAIPADGGYMAAGRFEAAAAGAVEDLVFGTLGGLKVAFGAEPGTVRDFPALFPSPPLAVSRVRLLPRAADVAIASIGTGRESPGQLTAVDLSGARPPAVPALLSVAVPPFIGAEDGDLVDRVYPLRLSPAALSAGVDDAVLPLYQGLLVVWHRAAPAGPVLSALDLEGVASGARDALGIAEWLPPGLTGGGSVHGAAALDADGDGTPDLVFSYAHDRSPDLPGELLYAANGGTAASLAVPPWRSLKGRADLAAIVDPLTLRALPLDPPAVAVFDRGLQAIVLLRGDARSGFTTSSLEAPGVTVREMVLADVVGSAAPDLVVHAVRSLTEAEVWVYPDAGDQAPRVAFDPPAPAEALRGQDLPLAVSATDPDGTCIVAWLLGGRLSAPAGAGLAWTVPGSALCQAGAAIEVTARATDDLGVFAEAAASIAVAARPSLRLVGEPPDRLVLPPGGVSAEAEGQAWPACGRTATFSWGEAGLPGLVEQGVTGGPAWSRRAFAVPEAAYPDALAGAPALTLAAVDDLGASGQATLQLAIDASGLVEASVGLDRPALAPGEVAMATARLRSRIGAPLPAVRVALRGTCLAVAGPAEASGASIVPGAAAGEWVLDALPGLDGEVAIRVPVRAEGGPGSLSVEAFSSGGHRLTPAAGSAPPGQELPGCGCGGGPGGAAGLLGLLALLLPSRRRRAT
jgi:hypothetical protein